MEPEMIQRVKNVLKSRHYTMNDSWLQDCLDYCASEISRNHLEKILDFITTQWNLSDLKEINNEKGCLPLNLSDKLCVTLPGNYILQMNTMYDISMPKFKQLEKMRNVATDNIDATEVENVATQASDLKAKRMYQLSLTDGRQDLTAIEYKQVTLLNDSCRLLPGIKLLLKGPVKCRRGVIMLQDENLSGIGGEVETLLIPNALENVLARALNLAENPNPYSVNSDSQQTLTLAPNPLRNQNVSNEKNISQVSSNSNKPAQKPPPSLNLMGNNTRNLTNNFPNDEELMEMMCDEIDSQNDANKVKKETNFSSQGSVEFPDDDDDFCFEEEKFVAERAVTKRLSAVSLKQEEELADFSGDFETDFQDAKDAVIDLTCPEKEEKSVAAKSVVASTGNGGVGKNEKLNVDSKKVCKLFESPRVQNEDKRFNFLEKRSVMTKSPAQSKSQQISPGIKRKGDEIPPSALKSSPKIKRVVESVNSRKITEFMCKKPKLCDFLADILKQYPNYPDKTKKTIRGQLLRLSQKLDFSGDKWILAAVLTDKTDEIQVDFSSEVIEKIFGLTVPEFREKKKNCKGNPQLTRQFKNQVSENEVKLKRLDSLIEIEFCPNKKPLVTNVTDLTDQQKEEIDQQLKNR